jgi:DNA polymerase-3 subunit beta
VRLIAEKNGVRVASGQFKLSLRALDAKEFPVLSAPAGKSTLINGALLRKLLRNVHPCISATEKRYNINGALLVLSGNTLALVTTDGKRLAVATGAFPGDPLQYQVILPTKLIENLIADDADDYGFSHSDNVLFFSTDAATITSRMIDGQFPNYQRIIPQSNHMIVTAPRDALNAALKRVSAVAGDTKIVNFSVSDGILQVQAKNNELGDAIENVAVTYAGPATRVNVQAQAIIDFLDCADNASIEMKMGGPSAAVLLADGQNFITVAMAVRL